MGVQEEKEGSIVHLLFFPDKDILRSGHIQERPGGGGAVLSCRFRRGFKVHMFKPGGTDKEISFTCV